MSGFGAFALSILMISAFLLTGGGFYLIISRRDRLKGALMMLAAAVMIGNVLIWAL
jgi:hypothetical protein